MYDTKKPLMEKNNLFLLLILENYIEGLNFTKVEGSDALEFK